MKMNECFANESTAVMKERLTRKYNTQEKNSLFPFLFTEMIARQFTHDPPCHINPSQKRRKHNERKARLCASPDSWYPVLPEIGWSPELPAPMLPINSRKMLLCHIIFKLRSVVMLM